MTIVQVCNNNISVLHW